MKKEMKPMDWVVGYYLGYIILDWWGIGLFHFASIWFMLFLIWISICNRRELWFWKIDSFKEVHLELLFFNVMLIVGNRILSGINRIEFRNINPIILVDASICEEILFRGYLFVWLEKRFKFKNGERKYWKNFGVIVLSSTIFSGVHCINLWSGYDLSYVCLQLAITFVAGLVLGTTRMQSGGIRECILIHMLFNLASCI